MIRANHCLAKPSRRSVLGTCVMLLAAGPLGAQGTPRATVRASAAAGWTPELSMRYRQPGDVAISPDGGRIAYVVRSAATEGKESKYVSRIWVAAADGSSDRQYTRGEGSASSPAFSPDGSSLAFLAARGENAKTQVWVLPLSGGEAWQLTRAAEGVQTFAWSPDGRRVAFTSRDTASAAERKRKEEKRDEFVVDSAFHHAHLYTVAVSAGDDGEHFVRRLTAGDYDVRSFDWSPDGRTLAFQRQPDPRIATGMIAGDIATVPSDSGPVKAIVERAGVDAEPLYSPDGRTIAFVSNGGRPEPVHLMDVWVVPSSGGEPRRLGDTPDRAASLVGWSADGRTLYARETVHTQGALIAVPADGSAPRTLVPPSGTIGAVALAGRAGRMALTWEDTDTPGDVYISPVAKLALTKLTALNADVPKPAMGRTELVAWKSSKDGRPIEGLLTYPVDYKEGRRYPLILNVHGGPAGAFAQSFTGDPGIYMLQYFAQHGYAILRPNPRGSTGYGKEFRYANVEDWGGGDFQDLMDGVDHVLAMGLTSPDSLVEMGWSYGGYMTSWIVTHTDRFRAASMGAGLPDLISMSMTTDIPDYLVAHMGGKEPWQDVALYQARSPMYAIANVKTPTQVLHGAEDERVPTSQGYEFYHALERLGVPTQMVLFPRTPHGPREPKLLMDVSPRILAWFDRFLGRQSVQATR